MKIKSLLKGQREGGGMHLGKNVCISEVSKVYCFMSIYIPYPKVLQDKYHIYFKEIFKSRPCP